MSREPTALQHKMDFGVHMLFYFYFSPDNIGIINNNFVRKLMLRSVYISSFSPYFVIRSLESPCFAGLD